MKNKGFTLVELIVVIVILVIITSIIVVNLSGIQNNTNEVKLKNYEEKISSAACQYIDKSITNMEELDLSTVSDCSRTSDVLKTRNDCKDNAGGCYVCISTLIDEGLIDKNLIDPNTNQPVKNELSDIKVLVKWKQNSDGDKIKECSYIGKGKPSEDINIIAQKELYYDYNGGSGSIESKIIEVGQPIGTLPTATRSGYVLEGWYTAKTGGTKVTSTTTMWNTNTTIYARWQTDQYKIVFNANGGSGAPSTIDFNGSSATSDLPSIKPTRSGYTFYGWAATSSWNTKRVGYSSSSGCTTAPDGTIATVTGSNWNIQKYLDTTSGSLDSNKTLTLYAQWQADKYKITFNANGGSGSPSDIEFNGLSATSDLPATKPTRNGYAFFGWAATSSWNTKRVGYSSSYGCTTAPDGTTATVTGSGWNIQKYLDTTSGSLDSNKTLNLYAQWQKAQYKLTYNGQGGVICEPGYKYADYGSTWGTLCTPSKDRNRFDGWYTGPNGTGTQITSSTQVTGDLTVYAKWTQRYKTEYRGLRYFPHEGLDSMTGQEIVSIPSCPDRTDEDYMRYYTLCTPDFSYFDYHGLGADNYKYAFDGWYTGPNGTGTKVTSSMIATGDVTLYMNWKYFKMQYDTYTETWNSADFSSRIPYGGCNVPNRVTYGVVMSFSRCYPSIDYNCSGGFYARTYALDSWYSTYQICHDRYTSYLLDENANYKCLVTKLPCYDGYLYID